MGIEIERKFLVDPSKLPKLGEGSAIAQGYLSFSPAVRIRTKDRTKAYLTIKGEGTISRLELEYEIPLLDATYLFAEAHAFIEKVRHEIKVGAHTWEVDVFYDEDAIDDPLGDGVCPVVGYLAEIELSSEDEEFVKPDWVTEEVTEDPRYSNAWMAQHGFPTREPEDETFGKHCHYCMHQNTKRESEVPPFMVRRCQGCYDLLNPFYEDSRSLDEPLVEKYKKEQRGEPEPTPTLLGRIWEYFSRMEI